MSSEDKERSEYYQGIAAAFFRQRGGGAVLTSRDLAVIASWESMGIPLPAVREGIDRAFEYARTIAPVRRNLKSLAACTSQVLRAFERHRERTVGGAVKVRTRREKKERIAAEARRFLDRLPAAVSFLEEPYARALELLTPDQPDEDALERLEAEVERRLETHAAQSDRDEARRVVADEFPGLKGDEAVEAGRLKLIKSLREKFKIPYITFPYY
jgi:hypothetical protein